MMYRLFTLIGLVLFGVSIARSQHGLIVNEVSQGPNANKDWIELLVYSEDCSPVDLRHWIIDDNNGIFTDCPGPDNGAVANVGINRGHVRFTDDDIWAAVPAGTLILIYNYDPNSPNNQAELGGLVDDYFDDDCDYVRVMPLNSSNPYIEKNDDFPRPPTSSSCQSGALQCPNGGDGNPTYSGGSYSPLDDLAFYAMPSGKIGFSVNADGCQTRTPAGEYFHGFCWGTPPPLAGCSDTSRLSGGPDNLYISAVGNQGVTYILYNLVNEDFRDVANYGVRSTNLFATPGSPNSCENAAWIAGMRAPVVFNAQDNCSTDTVGLLRCVGDTLNLLDVLDGGLCQDRRYEMRVLSGDNLVSLVDSSLSSLSLDLLSSGELTISVEFEWSHDELFSGLMCSDMAIPSRYELVYDLAIVDVGSDSLDVDILVQCGDPQDSAVFDLDAQSSLVKANADSVHFFLDPQGLSQIVNPINTGGEIVYARYYVGNCQSPLEALDLIVDPITRDTFAESVCESFVLDLGGLRFDMDSPSGSVIVASQTPGTCDTLVFVDLDYSLFASRDTLNLTLCAGDSFQVGNSVYDMDRPMGVDTFFGASAIGCDSIVFTNVSFVMESVSEISGSLCAGDTLYVGDEFFDVNRLMGEVRLEGMASSGCDSLVQVELTVEDLPEVVIMEEICEGDTVLYNGVEYHLGNLQGRDTLPSLSSQACDTILIVELSPVLSSQLAISMTLCPEDTMVVNGRVYDRDNPQGVEVIVGGASSGCDSVVTVDLTFRDEAVGMVREVLCSGDSVMINGQWFSAEMSTGMQILEGQSAQGCDSIVDIELDVVNPVTVQIIQDLCQGDSLLVGSTWYHEGNLTGQEVLSAANGCDSTVIVSLELLMESMMDITSTICQGDTLSVGAGIYTTDNPTGTEILEGQAANGCDSIVNVDLTPVYWGVNLVRDTLPWDSTREIAGMIFSREMQEDTLLLEGGASNGCDSLLVVELVFDSLNFEAFAFSPQCPDELGELYLESLEPYAWPVQVEIVGEADTQRRSVDLVPIEWYDLVPGTYNMNLVDASGFSGKYTFEIAPPSGYSFSLDSSRDVFFGEQVILGLFSDAPLDSLSWSPSDSLSCSDCMSPSFLARTDQTYRVLGWDDNGCVYEAQILIRVSVDDNVYVPNAFSPNGDQINDRLIPLVSDRIAKIEEFAVYDRWGALVYQMADGNSDHNVGWDGTCRGQEAPVGVYVYSVRLQLADGRVVTRSGDVTLIR